MPGMHIRSDGNIWLTDEDGLLDHFIGFFERMKYRCTDGILKYLNTEVELSSYTTLESIILMLKKYPSFYKVFPDLKKLVDKYDEVKYKPSNKPQFKYIEFYRYMDTLNNNLADTYVNNVKINYTKVIIDAGISVMGTHFRYGHVHYTPGQYLENILNLRIKLNADNLPNHLPFTMNDFLSLLEYTLCYEFNEIVE